MSNILTDIGTRVGQELKADRNRLTALEQKDITVTLTGDVTGTGTIVDLGNVSIATTVAPNSVALGTDTTGNYVESVAGKTGVVTLVKGDVGLGNVDNTSDENKPISTATQTALNTKAPLANPALTGTPTAPTAAANTNTTQLATTAFVEAATTPAQLLADIKTVDGAGSGLDADTVDGLDSTQFLRSDTNSTLTGTLTVNGTINGTAVTTSNQDYNSKLATTKWVKDLVMRTGGNYAEIKNILASDPDTSDYFGNSCALNSDGTVLAVGATGWDGTAGADQGKVYIYDINGTTVTERTTVLASDAGTSDYFGSSCSLNSTGTVLAVGANGWEGAYNDQGKVYIYDISGTTVTERTTVLASDAGANDFFGASCSLNSDGTVLAVSAYGWDGAYNDQGKVYIYDISGTTVTQRTTVLTSDAGANTSFGNSCALNSDGTVLAVGTLAWDGASTDQGKVYIYDINGTTVTERTTVLASDAGTSDFFGASCSLNSDGTVLAVGASWWLGAYGHQGKVYIYDINGTTLTERTTVLASDAGANDFFGASCSLNSDGTVLAVGATHWDGAYGDQGTVYLFTGKAF